MKPRILVIAGVGYLAGLAGVVLAGFLLFRDLYAAPAPGPDTIFAPDYQTFLSVSGGLLAILLGSLAGFLGVVQGRWWLGAAALVGGTAVTAAALSVLPWVRFPFDQYAAGAVWLFSSLPIGLGAWALATLFGMRRRHHEA